MEKIYENIRAMRKRLGLSQEELARRVGYTDRSTIAKIESGKVDLTNTKIREFANALNSTPAHLMGWDTAELEPIDMPEMIPIPVLGCIHAGNPVLTPPPQEIRKALKSAATVETSTLFLFLKC